MNTSSEGRKFSFPSWRGLGPTDCVQSAQFTWLSASAEDQTVLVWRDSPLLAEKQTSARNPVDQIEIKTVWSKSLPYWSTVVSPEAGPEMNLYVKPLASFVLI